MRIARLSSPAHRPRERKSGPGVVSARPLTRTALEALKARLQTAYAERLKGQPALTDEERLWLQLGHEHGLGDVLRVLEAAGLKVEER